MVSQLILSVGVCSLSPWTLASFGKKFCSSAAHCVKSLFHVLKLPDNQLLLTPPRVVQHSLVVLKSSTSVLGWRRGIWSICKESTVGC